MYNIADGFFSPIMNSAVSNSTFVFLLNKNPFSGLSHSALLEKVQLFQAVKSYES